MTLVLTLIFILPLWFRWFSTTVAAIPAMDSMDLLARNGLSDLTIHLTLVTATRIIPIPSPLDHLKLDPTDMSIYIPILPHVYSP